LHITNKLIERCSELLDGRVIAPGRYNYLVNQTNLFVKASNLPLLDARVCYQLALWEDQADLESTRDNILALMEEADPAKPVPAEDSNKHAERICTPMDPSGDGSFRGPDGAR
jgi:hypothetical protein